MYFAIKKEIDNAGRILIPKEVRKHFNISAGCVFEIIPTKDGVLLKIAPKK